MSGTNGSTRPRDVLVAMSGGVDSSVAAALLVSEGYNVVGVTLKLWGGLGDSGCCSVADVEDARRVAQQLSIDHHVFNFGDDFNRFVVDPYVADHQSGRTPNPCVECNRHIKFDKLFRRADALGFDLVATGHHARIVTSTDGRRWIGRGADAGKDQSYVLHMLDQTQLGRLLFPVGELTKDRVRALADELGLRTANKPDSQDVCFIHSVGGRQVFLGDRIPLRPAVVVDDAGAEVGTLESIEVVTLGQRRGLNVGGNPDRRYVTDIDHQAARVTIGPRRDLLVEAQRVENVDWAHQPVHGPCRVQCSAHGSVRVGRIEAGERPDRVIVVWDQPQQLVAVGQSMVFYRRHGGPDRDGTALDGTALDDTVLGGGVAAAVVASNGR
ncbi:MAG: tRNA 2-thiouridine(34) synthase MnmA [Acidimicrobiia bacterium]|nr:tRNA 2-thiouridine(34) synthase MnmA [Acidimicrobiia bacterium]